MQRSFDFKGQSLNSPEQGDRQKDYYTQVPSLMLSQQSSASRKQIEDRYKTNIKNSKLTSKLKSKKKK